MKKLTANLELRDAEKREIVGVAVPWDSPTKIWGELESFERGAAQLETPAPLLFGHSDPIGVITEATDTERGLEIVARISNTQLGNDALALCKDKAVTGLSIGFEPVEWKYNEEKDETIITLADVREVSLVAVPAYKDAQVQQTRNRKETPNMDTTLDKLSERQTELASDLDLLSRKFESLQVQDIDTLPDDPTLATRSFGEYVKLMAREESAGKTWDGVKVGDTNARPAWLGTITKLMEEKQQVTNLFTRSKNLPREGMTLEYGLLKDESMKVELQAKEGDDLAFGKLSYETKSAPVKTYGGYTSVSRQVIERAPADVLSTAFNALALKYASRIETETRALLDKTYTENATSAPLTLKALNSATALDWQKLVLDAAIHFDALLVPLHGLVVSPNVFAHLIALPKVATALQLTGAPVERQGTATISVPGEATLAGLKVVANPAWTGDKVAAYSSAAIEIKEDGSAPTRLQDDNIINLTRAFSVYGYAAHYAPFPKGIAPVKIGS